MNCEKRITKLLILGIMVFFTSACSSRNGSTSSGGKDNDDDKKSVKEWTGIFQSINDGNAGSVTDSYATAVDNSGNVFIVGTSNASIDNQNLLGESGTLIVKYNSSGEKVWTRLISQSNGYIGVWYARSIAIDNTGNILIAGMTDLGINENTKNGIEDGFLAKIDTDGNQLWIKQFGVAGGYTDFSAISIDASNEIYLTGAINKDAFGQTVVGSKDALLARFNSSGDLVWMRTLGAASAITHGLAVELDNDEFLYICGFTDGSLPGNSEVGTRDAFFAKYDLDGNFISAKQIGTTGTQTVSRSCVLDANKNVYLAGTTYGDLTGGFVPGGGAYLFLAKFDSLNSVQWIKQYGENGGDSKAHNLLITEQEGETNLYMTGITSVGIEGATQTGDRDMFLLKVSDLGTTVWSKQLGSDEHAEIKTDGYGLAVDEHQNIYVCGMTMGNFSGINILNKKSAYIVSYTPSGQLR